MIMFAQVSWGNLMAEVGGQTLDIRYTLSFKATMVCANGVEDIVKYGGAGLKPNAIS